MQRFPDIVELFMLLFADDIVLVSDTVPQWGTADAKSKNPPGGSQGLSKVPSF